VRGARQHQLRAPATGSEVTYICHGESCKAAPRSGNFRMGVLPLPIAAAFGDSQPLNSERDHLYSDRQLLPLPFLRENLNVKKGESECHGRPGLPLLRTTAFENFCSLLVQPAGPFGLLTTWQPGGYTSLFRDCMNILSLRATVAPELRLVPTIAS
jgi:hypothetical protein